MARRGRGGREVEGETDASFVSPCHVTLTHSSTYDRWRCVGAEQRLASDNDIACFLLKCYDQRTTTSVGGAYCTTCQSLLTLTCVHCGTTGTETSPIDSIPVETTSRPASNNRRNLRSRRKILPVLQNRVPTQTRAYLRSKQAPPSPTSKSYSGTTVASPNFQSSNGVLVSGEKLCSVTSNIGERLRKDDDKLEDRDTWLDLKVEPLLDVVDTTPDVPLSCSSAGGRGRPRKYPPIPLDCCVCGKKLSTRVSVLNHIKKKHPEAEVPEFYQSILNPKVCSGKKASKGREKKKLYSVSEDSKDNRCDVKTFNEDTSDIDVSEDTDRFGVNLSENKDESNVNAASEKETKSERHEAMKKLRKAELESLKCATCGVQFEHKRQMYTHRRLCTSKVCHLCGKSVKLLEMHLKRHTSASRFPCPHCPKSFLFRNYLEQHLLYHNNERPYCCEICGMRYREKTRLNAHIRTHTGSKPYKCSQCDAAFTRPRGLNDHMRVHTGEKPYACQVCNRHFSSSGNLAAHRRKVHGLEPQVPNRMTRKLFVVETGVEEGLGEVETNRGTSTGKGVTSDCADSGASPHSTQCDFSVSSEVTQVSVSPVASPSSGTAPLNHPSSAASAEGSVISRVLMADEGSTSSNPGVLVKTGFVHNSGLSIPPRDHANSFVVSPNLETADQSRISLGDADNSRLSLGDADNSRLSLGVADNSRVLFNHGTAISFEDSPNLGAVLSSVVPLNHRTTTSSVISCSPGALSQPRVPTSCQQNGCDTDGGVLVGSRAMDTNHGCSMNNGNPGTTCPLPHVQGVSPVDHGIIINSDASLHSCLLVGAGIPLNSFVPVNSSSGPVSVGIPHDFVPVSSDSRVPVSTDVPHDPC